MRVKNLGHRRSRNMLLKANKVNFGVVTLSFVTIMVLCLIVLFYIIQVNEIVNQGYLKSEREKEIQELVDENEELKSNIAHSKSINNSQFEGEKINLQDAETINMKFVEVTTDVFVVNDE